jgi:hypothetical protein
VAIFGRNSARQRLRRAARESLKIPPFGSPVDCTPWVTGGLWPAELSAVTPDNAPLIKYLRADLQRIVNFANDQLQGIRRAGLTDSTRRLEEARVINDARAFAVRRVESTVRYLRNMSSKLPAEPLRVSDADDVEKTKRLDLAPPRPNANLSTGAAAPLSAQRDRRPLLSVEQLEIPEPPLAELSPPTAEPASVRREQPGLAEVVDSGDTEALEEITTLLQESAPLAVAPLESPSYEQRIADPSEPPAGEWWVRRAEPTMEDTETAAHLRAVQPAKSEREWLQRILEFVARQEPRLRWAVGVQEDGATLLVTDLAHGWIPPGITLPAGVRLLEPRHRTGTVATLLGETTWSETYAPGDQLNSVTDHDPIDTSLQPLELPAIDDLGWSLSEATHWRDGLPQIVNTLAKAGAAGTGILDSEIDVLRMHLENTRSRLVAQYPGVEGGALLNCQLLAATEGLATNNELHANYHFAWFQRLSAPWPGGWTVDP